MRTRIIIGSLVVCLLILVGLWSTAYFQILKAQKDFISDIENKGYHLSFEKIKTSGFPYQIKRTSEQFILRSQEGATPFYMQGGPITLSVTLFSPSKLHIMLGESKCSVDRHVAWNFDSAHGVISLDQMHNTSNDEFTITGANIKKGDIELISYPEIQCLRGKKNNSLFFETVCKRPQFLNGKSFYSLSFKGYIDTPHKSWMQLNTAFSDELHRLKKEVNEAVYAGQTELPLIYEWINTLEEQQMVGHFIMELQQNENEFLLCETNLGIVDAMPHGIISISGNGELYSNILASLKNVASEIENQEMIELSIKSNGVFHGKTNLLPYQPVAWKTYPLVTEAIVCDTFKLYSHGDFRKARAEYAKATEDPATQYTIGEGYLLDSQYDTALTWFKRAGLQHYPKALLHMAYHYFHGYGCEKNEILAREFTEDAVCHGLELKTALEEFTDNEFIDWAEGVVGEKTSPGDK